MSRGQTSNTADGRVASCRLRDWLIGNCYLLYRLNDRSARMYCARSNAAGSAQYF